MKLTIEIDMDNAAFEDRPATEVRRIFAEVVYKIMGRRSKTQELDEKLLDINGNSVGRVRLEVG